MSANKTGSAGDEHLGAAKVIEGKLGPVGELPVRHGGDSRAGHGGCKGRVRFAREATKELNRGDAETRRPSSTYKLVSAPLRLRGKILLLRASRVVSDQDADSFDAAFSRSRIMDRYRSIVSCSCRSNVKCSATCFAASWPMRFRFVVSDRNSIAAAMN